jgi:hypothetical protein
MEQPPDQPPWQPQPHTDPPSQPSQGNPPRPQQPYYPPYQQPPQPPKKKRRTWLWIVLGSIAFLLFACIGLASLGKSVQPTTTSTAPTSAPTTNAAPTQAVTQAPTVAPTPTPTPQSIHYPPTTKADLRGLAAQGDASAIHEFHSESVGLTGVCPQPKREVTVDPRVTGRQLAEDLLAYFYAQQFDNPCGSVVFAYHTQGEANDAYTAGRISLDVTDSSGAPNVDPNATNLTYTLTLDVGDVYTGKEYVVKY